jgi:type VI secretion system secreted protein Hcp
VADRWFLKVDGIRGESTDVAHKDEIDVQSWSWGVTNSGAPGAGSGAGGGAGRTEFQDFYFVGRVSKASPPLFQACATGNHIKEANLSGVRDVGKGKGADYLKYRLSDVTVTSYHQSDNEGGLPTDQFSLGYAKIEVSYTAQSPSGKLEPPITAGFDLKANKKL